MSHKNNVQFMDYLKNLGIDPELFRDPQLADLYHDYTRAQIDIHRVQSTRIKDDDLEQLNKFAAIATTFGTQVIDGIKTLIHAECEANRSLIQAEAEAHRVLIREDGEQTRAMIKEAIEGIQNATIAFFTAANQRNLVPEPDMNQANMTTFKSQCETLSSMLKRELTEKEMLTIWNTVTGCRLTTSE